jgi:hypothetical protein
MLVTPLFLFESPFGRVLNMYVPGFIIRGPGDFGLIITAILSSMALELLFIAVICMKYRWKSEPFMIAAGFIVAQMVTMGLLGDLKIQADIVPAGQRAERRAVASPVSPSVR